MYGITFTDAATAHIMQSLSQQGGVGFRIGVKATGCAGFTYIASVVQQAVPDDLCFVWADKFTVYLDAKIDPALYNLTVDLVVADKMLALKRLVFVHKQEQGRCGCGESFYV